MSKKNDKANGGKGDRVPPTPMPQSPTFIVELSGSLVVLDRMLDHAEQVTLPFPPFPGLRIAGSSISYDEYVVRDSLWDADRGCFVCSDEGGDLQCTFDRPLTTKEAERFLEHGTIEGCATLDELRKEYPDVVEADVEPAVTTEAAQGVQAL